MGVEGAFRLKPMWRLRAGFDWTPPVKVPMHFSIGTFKDGAINSGNFDRLQELMYKMTGVEVDQTVDMRGKPQMYNFKFLVDFYPWADKGWRVTAGVFAGNHHVASAINTMEEMPSLLAVAMYNRMYEAVMDPSFEDTQIIDGVYIDPDVIAQLREKFEAHGKMGIMVGDFKSDGKPYIMYPDKDGMVKANGYVNRVKPYLGIGYDSRLRHGASRWTLGFDAGVLFWGGSPDIYTSSWTTVDGKLQMVDQDGVNLTKDVTNIRGNAGSWMRTIRHFKVWPVLSFRIAYTL